MITHPIKVVFRSFRYSMGLSIKVKGECKSKEEAGALLLAPHSTIFDNFIIDAVSPFTTAYSD